MFLKLFLCPHFSDHDGVQSGDVSSTDALEEEDPGFKSWPKSFCMELANQKD